MGHWVYRCWCSPLKAVLKHEPWKFTGRATGHKCGRLSTCFQTHSSCIYAYALFHTYSITHILDFTRIPLFWIDP